MSITRELSTAPVGPPNPALGVDKAPYTIKKKPFCSVMSMRVWAGDMCPLTVSVN